VQIEGKNKQGKAADCKREFDPRASGAQAKSHFMKVYTYAKCSTCRDAVKWLRERQIAFSEMPIQESPPTKTELRAAIVALGSLKRVFNTSGLEYRRLKLADRWDQLREEEALGLLTSNGMLIKRPLVIGAGIALAGFEPTAWSEALSR
jgi:arsenate reductase